jgi:hypothetical protein
VGWVSTNVENTMLMPIGCLNEPICAEITDLGFELGCDSKIKCLGLVINNKAELLTDHFTEKITKIRQLIGMWGQYSRIAISKTMVVSQIGYIGCIISPTVEQLKTMQQVINDYVSSGIVVAVELLYTKPSEGNEGGLGLLNLDSYIQALQSQSTYFTVRG